MPAFGRTSRRRLETCHEDLQKIFNEVVKRYDCSILEGHRDKETQNEYYRTGRSRVKYPNSKHNAYPSRGVDVAPYFSKSPHIRWDDKEKFYHFAGYVTHVADSLGIKIRWGGDWDSDGNFHDQTFMDLPHFELVTED